MNEDTLIAMILRDHPTLTISNDPDTLLYWMNRASNDRRRNEDR